MKRKPRRPGATAENKKLEEEILHASEADVAEFETTVFEGKPFSKFEKFLKSMRKVPAIQPTVRKGTASSANGNERCELFSDCFVSTFG